MIYNDRTIRDKRLRENHENTRNADADKHPRVMLQYSTGLSRLQSALCKPPAWRQVKSYLFWGPPGTGKSRRVHESEPDLYSKPDGEWWDGYCGQKAILFDDFRGQNPLHCLLRWLDGYPIQVPIKGGFVWAMWERVYFTSNFDIPKWYPGCSAEGLAPLMRRLPYEHVVHMPLVRKKTDYTYSLKQVKQRSSKEFLELLRSRIERLRLRRHSH